MNTRIRAHRILNSMPNYKRVESSDEWKPLFSSVALGEAIGRYMNPQPTGEIVAVFEDGVAFSSRSGHAIQAVKYEEIFDLTLPNEKASEEIEVIRHDGSSFRLPVRGYRGRFFDSLEFLRFLRRTVGDIQRQRTS